MSVQPESKALVAVGGDIEPWLQQRGETGAAFHMFEHYRDQMPFERSLKRGVESHWLNCKKQNGSKNVTPRITRWKRENNWDERVQAHDDDLARKRRQQRAADLETAMDRAGQIMLGIRTATMRRIADLDPAEIPVSLLPSLIRLLPDIEWTALGYNEREVDMTPTGPQLQINFVNTDPQEARDVIETVGIPMREEQP